MNTVKIFLAESGRIADLRKDFPLYQGQFQNKLLNVYVPTSILAPQYDIQHYIGQISGVSVTNNELNAFVEANTYPSREPSEGDIVEFYNTNPDATDRFIRYTFYNNAWSSSVVSSFGTFTTLAGTSVKIGMTAIQRSGSVYKSKSYFMRYLKTLTYQNVEYALYERKLPKEFTLYAGQGVNAPVLIANVVNVNMGDNATSYEVTSMITSQTCSLDVMTSTMLDQDPTVEPSDMELITAQMNSLSADILLKQDKIDDELNTTSKSVVGGINELNSQVVTNTANIGTNTEDIADIKLEQITQNNDIDENKGKIRDNTLDISVLQGKVATLEEQAITGENPIGELSGTSAPSDSALTAFVVEEAGRQPKGGDVVTYTQIISGGTDKIFKCIYSSATTSWSWYEIPATEKAANDTYGIVKGGYSAGNTTDPTQVNIVGGDIKNVYVLDNQNAQRDIREYLNTNNTRLGTVETKESQNELDIASATNRVGTLEGSMTNILNGTTAVGKATKADQDGNGNNIVSTYMTQQAGATKLELKDYALPRTFNDVSFLTATGYSSEIPSTENPIYSVTTQDIGDTEIFQATKTISNVEFQLANKNSYTDTIYVSADVPCSVEFRLTTEIYNNNQWVEANVEITDIVNLNANEMRKLSFASTFNSLTDVISVVTGNAIRQTLEVITSTSSQITFDIYSNSTYPSTFYLNTTAQTIVLAQGYLGELNYLSLTGSVDNDVLSFTIPSGLQIFNNTQYLLNLSYNGSLTGITSVKLVYNLTDIPIITPYNYGTQNDCTLTDLEQVYYSLSNGTSTWQFCGIFRLENLVINLYTIIDNLTSLKSFINNSYLNFNESQSLTDTQKAQARQNIGAGSANATSVIVNGQVQSSVSFTSDPQTQIDNRQATLPTTTTAGQVLKSTSTAGTLEWGSVTGGVPESSTPNQVYGTNASGNQTTFNLSDSGKFIQEINDQYIRITDLNTGIYKLTYPTGGTYLYYNGTTSTSNHLVVGSANTGDVYLYVNKTDGGGLNNYWGWYYIVSVSDYPTIYYGYTSEQSGFLGTSVNLGVIQKTSNLVTSLSSSSTNTQYPSAKLVYDQLALKQDATDNNLNTTSKTVTGAINEVNSLAKEANKAEGFASYSALITALNSASATAYNVGQSFYVQTLDVPDLWVISVESSSVSYTYTTDAAFITATGASGGQQVGYYKLAQLETQKVDLTNYVQKSTTIAGVDLQDNITKTELLTALNVADGAQVNDVIDFQVNDISVVSNKVGKIVTETAYNASTNKIATMSDVNKKLSTYANDSTVWDTTPTENSTKPITSGGVYTELLKYYKYETVYDMNSNDSSINWGYTSGIQFGSISKSIDLSKYKQLICFCRRNDRTCVGVCDLDTSSGDSSADYRFTAMTATVEGSVLYTTFFSFYINSSKSSVSFESAYQNTSSKNGSSSYICYNIIGVY